MPIAQINIGTVLWPMSDPRMSGFADYLDKINAMAEKSSGFLWRLQDESGHATDIQIFDDPKKLVNMSVWESVEDLMTFAYQTEHLEFIKQRGQWFEKPSSPHMCLWTLPIGKFPTTEEGKNRLWHYQQHDSCEYAFDFKTWEKWV